MSSNSPIIVVGAGVIGLSTATRLQSLQPQRPIAILAAELPADPSPSADYASPWAGAHYRPIPGSTPQLKYEAELAWITNDEMKKLASAHPESGIQITRAVEYLENPPKENLLLKTGDVYAGKGDSFRVIPQEELPEGANWGCEYEAYCANVLIYCKWLMERFEAKGGTVLKCKLENAKDAFEFAKGQGLGDASTVVNCSGRNFDTDVKVKFIRGQTVLVKNQYDKTVTRQNEDGSWSFLIPRPLNGGTIVGGTKEIGDIETQPRHETRRKLLEQSLAAFPDFVQKIEDFEVVRDVVGRRPWREGGLRMEVEVVEGSRRIVHGYGAGGRGYELSWGVANKLVELVGHQ